MFGAQAIFTALLKQVKLVYQWELVGCSMVFVREPKLFTHTFMAEVGERNCNSAFFSSHNIHLPTHEVVSPLWLEVRGGGRKETIWRAKRRYIKGMPNHTKLGGRLDSLAESTGIMLPSKLKSCLHRKSWIIIVLTAIYCLSGIYDYIYLCISVKIYNT